MRAALSARGTSPSPRPAVDPQAVQHSARCIQLAATARMSDRLSTHTSRRSREALRMKYVKPVRLHQARLLMVQGGRTAGAAAAEVGYESPSPVRPGVQKRRCSVGYADQGERAPDTRLRPSPARLARSRYVLPLMGSTDGAILKARNLRGNRAAIEDGAQDKFLCNVASCRQLECFAQAHLHRPPSA